MSSFKPHDHILDPGIVEAVRILQEHGVETCQSCEGGEGHAYPKPTVEFLAGDAGAGFKALGVAFTYGLPVSELSLFWSVQDGKPTGPYWKLTFTEKLLPRSKYNPNNDLA